VGLSPEDDSDSDDRSARSSRGSISEARRERETSLEPGKDLVFPNVFVTVGTTSFDDLVTWVLDEKTLKYFKKWKTEEVRVQFGSTKLYEEETRTIGNILFEFYQYKNSLLDDYIWADLVIGHGGAGTVSDALDLEKTLLVIPNETLMDNHQIELGDFLQKEQYAYSARLEKAHNILSKIRREPMRRFPIKETKKFADELEELMDFDPVELERAKVAEEADVTDESDKF